MQYREELVTPQVTISGSEEVFQHLVRFLWFDYSSLNESTGLATAARIACQLTVNKAINNAASPATTNIHHSIVVRKAKSFNQVFMPHHATGDAKIGRASGRERVGQ